MSMSTRDETAVIRITQHLREILGYLLPFQVHKTKSPDTGSVYQKSATVNRIHFIKRSGMFPLKVRGGDFPDFRIKGRIKGLYKT